MQAWHCVWVCVCVKAHLSNRWVSKVMLRCWRVVMETQVPKHRGVYCIVPCGWCHPRQRACCNNQPTLPILRPCASPFCATDFHSQMTMSVCAHTHTHTRVLSNTPNPIRPAYLHDQDRIIYTFIEIQIRARTRPLCCVLQLQPKKGCLQPGLHRKWVCDTVQGYNKSLGTT